LLCSGGVLAHAFYPQNGETHFDDEERWVDRETDGIDVMTVTAHELGHALGLGHSAVSGALMAPYYQGYDPNFSLSDDDRQAIQSLYGTYIIRRLSTNQATTHTHTPFSGIIRVSRYQKGKTNLDFTEARNSEWQWHQLGHMQVCTSLQTDTTPAPRHSVFYRPDALPATQPTASKH